MDACDIERLVQACPNLRNLNLRDALEWEVSLLALTDLTDLTELEISQVTTESAVRILAQLSGLRELRVRQPSEVYTTCHVKGYQAASYGPQAAEPAGAAHMRERLP